MSIHRGLRVAFCGAGGTGKTTTAQFIHKDLGLDLQKSAARSIYEAKGLSEFKVLNSLMDEEKLDLQMEIFHAKIENDRQFSYVADRTVLDHYAYTLAYCGGFMTDNEFNTFDDMVQTRMRSTYSHVFFFPWGFWFPEISDDVRQDLHSWQSQIDGLILGHLVRWNIPFNVVPQSHGEDERNAFVRNIILGGEDS
jgi:hypothetical protein